MTPFLSQLMVVSFDFAPKGWAICAGQLFPIAQNQALFSLLGTTYGGDGRINFALPDLRGRAAISFGQGPGLAPYNLGQTGGVESVTLNQAQMPAHLHTLNGGSVAGNATKPGTGSNATLASSGATPVYTKSPPAAADAPMAPNMVSTVGQSQAHENRKPFLAMTWIIALQGIYPSRT